MIPFLKFIGFERETVSRAEKIASTLGGVLGIVLVYWVSDKTLGDSSQALIVPSMGASAVLLFAVPHGRLSQPWSLLGGHLLSALMGVLCYQSIPNIFLASGLAVGLAIGVMHLCACIHPPGGATALAAVIGGDAIHALGYQYVLFPVAVNVLIIFAVAVLFNGFFPWRRYPTALMKYIDTPQVHLGKATPQMDQRSIDQALEELDLIVDVTSEDLQRLFSLAMAHAAKSTLTADDIQLGRYYTNGLHGPDWCVRRIIDEHRSPDVDKDMVIYRVVEGPALRYADSCTRSAFAAWAAREVIPNGKTHVFD